MDSLFSILNWLSETNVQAAVIWPAVYAVFFFVNRVIDKKNSYKVTLSNLIQDIEESATEHWCSDPGDAENSLRILKIHQKLKNLARKINQKEERNKTALTEYRKVITGDDFDSPKRSIVTFEDSRILLIAEMAKNLRNTLKINEYH